MKQNAKKLPGKEAVPGKQTSGNWIVKLLCVIAAFFLWLYVMIVVNPVYQETFQDIPVRVVGMEELRKNSNLSIYDMSENKAAVTTIHVTVSGKRSRVLLLEAEEIVATADVSRITSAGKANVTIDVELPDGVSLVEKSMNKVSLTLEESAIKLLPLSENIVGLDLPSGYEHGTVEYSFDNIEVSGPKSIIDDIASAKVQIDFNGRMTSFEENCDIYFVNSRGNRVNSPYLQYDETQVLTRVPVYRSVTVPVEVYFKNHFINETNAVISVVPKEVTLKGEEDAMHQEVLLAPVILDEKNITDKMYGKTVSLQPAEGVMIQENNANVQVQVTLEDFMNHREMTVTDIQVTGASGLRYEIVEEELQIKLLGPVEELGKIRSSDLSAVVDLSGYSPENSGEITRTPIIEIDAEGVSNVCAVGDYTIHIEINK